MEVVVDTTVLIHLWRHRKPTDEPKLAELIEKVSGRSLLVPAIAQAEFLRGAYYQGISENVAHAYLSSFILLPIDREVVDRYARTWAEMKPKAVHISFADLWIASSALHKGCPLVTANKKHFTSIPKLELIPYTLSKD